MFKTSVYDATVTFSKDGSIHVELRSGRGGGTKASKRFTRDELHALFDWQRIADWESDPNPDYSQRIDYSHETGELRLVTGSGLERFDPHSEEALAKLVRKLKSRAPLPPALVDQPTLPDLPIPTAEQMANRTIYTTPSAAHGAKAPKRPNPARAATQAKTRQIAMSLLKASALQIKASRDSDAVHTR